MRKYIVLLSLSAFLSGCASESRHEHTAGAIVALDSKTEAHVCLTSSSATLGELVDIYEVVCTKTKAEPDYSKPTKSATYKSCNRVKKGHARIVENSDKHFCKVKSEADLELKEGFLIETSQTVLK